MTPQPNSCCTTLSMTSKDNAESTVLTYKNGMSKLLAECTKREDGAELSFLTLVSPATIEAYFDGDTVNQRADGHEQRVQYLAEPIIRCCMKIGKYLDPNFDTSGHEFLLARAQKESKDRASQDAPLYKHFVTTALREGLYVYANDPD